MRDPRKYFIFDARVSFALNQYCAEENANLPYFFPILPSRVNARRVEQCAVIKRLESNGARRFPNCAVLYFDIYCPIITGLAEKLTNEFVAPIMLYEQNQLDPIVRKNSASKFGFDILPHLVEMALFMKGK